MLFMACGENTKSKQNSANEKQENNNTVSVYYFHGKQRCKTCIAVENIVRETIETHFANNEKVEFLEIDTSEKNHEELVEKYEVVSTALIIEGGNNNINLTQQAFAVAIENPKKLVELIEQEVEKRLN